MSTSMDHSKYEYVNFENRPNVWLGFHLDTPAAASKKFKIDPKVLDVARIMIAKNSRNTYVFTGAKSDTNEVGSFARCTVERNDEVLGALIGTYGRKGNAVAVDNERVRRDRDRGGAMVTSDVKRAAALALKKFIPTPNEEVLIKEYGAINERLRTLVQTAQSRKNQALQSKSEHLLRYLEKHWETRGQAILAEAGIPASAIPDMTEAIEAHRNLATLRERHEKGLTFVHQRGDNLYATKFDLSGNRDLHQRAYAYEDAPGDMRAKVGMLKAVSDDGQYLPDCGMKLGPHTYVIFFDMGEEDDADADADEEDA